MEFDRWYKQFNATTPAIVPPQNLLPSTPPPPPAQSPPLGGATPQNINMESFLAGINFSRAHTQQAAFLPPQPPFTAVQAAFNLPPPPPAERLTMENILTLLKAVQPSSVTPSYSHGYGNPGQFYPPPGPYQGYQPPYYGYGPRQY